MRLLTRRISETNLFRMRLSDWLAKENMTQQAFAELIGVTQGRVSQVCSRGTDSLRLATKISDITNGEVPPDDVMHEEAAE